MRSTRRGSSIRGRSTARSVFALALLVGVLLVVGCTPLNSGITGIVLAGPACPGPTRIGSPCPDRPIAVQLVFMRNGTTQAGSVSSSSDGRFKVDLPAGSYTIRGAGGVLPFVTELTVIVPADGYIDVTVHADTGIR